MVGIRDAKRLRRARLAGVVLLLATRLPCPAGTTPALAHWTPFVELAGAIDLSVPRRDGSLTVTAGGQLSLLAPGGALAPFAREPGGYATSPDVEAYLALAPERRVRGADCAFRPDDLFVLDVTQPGVVVVDPEGEARRFADLPPGTFPNGIVFDGVGRFGHRLLVTALLAGATSVYALDCRGRMRTVTEGAPAIEGGMAVAPRAFGRHAGRLIAPDEVGGSIVAIDARGRARTLAMSGLAAGLDIGVESAGFVPRRFGPGWVALLADRGTPGIPPPGTGSILGLESEALLAAGVRPGDLLVATERGADTIAVRCRRRCTVRRVADGPALAHAEGHIVFVRRR